MATANPSVNPYQPPRATVADIDRATEEVQPIDLWSARGRIGRVRYIAYLVAGYLLLILVGMVAGAIAAMVHSPMVAGVLVGLFGLAYFVWTIMMLVQRTHDMGWTGWAALLTLIPFVALIWFVKAGTPGANAYGAPPPPNTRSVKILAWIFPAIFVIGIVAAIALPAYQGYVTRAKAAQMQAQPTQQP